jgi:hypothetical protein
MILILEYDRLAEGGSVNIMKDQTTKAPIKKKETVQRTKSGLKITRVKKSK